MKTKIAFVLAAILGAVVSPATAATVCTSGIIERPIEDVWKAIRDFGSHSIWIEGQPHIKLEGSSGTTVGVKRSTIFSDGLRFDEVLTGLDDVTYTIKYDVVGEIPIPAYDIHGVIQLNPISASKMTLAERCLTYDTGLPKSEAKAFALSRIKLLAGSLELLNNVMKR